MADGGDALTEAIRQLGSIGTAVATAVAVRWATRIWPRKQEQEHDEEDD